MIELQRVPLSAVWFLGILEKRETTIVKKLGQWCRRE